MLDGHTALCRARRRCAWHPSDHGEGPLHPRVVAARATPGGAMLPSSRRRIGRRPAAATGHRARRPAITGDPLSAGGPSHGWTRITYTPIRSADEVRFVAATSGLCGPVSRTSHGQTIKKAW